MFLQSKVFQKPDLKIGYFKIFKKNLKQILDLSFLIVLNK